MSTPLIDSYDFGFIIIDGKSYTADLIITSGHIQDTWWRSEGHRLSLDDLKEALAVNPEILIIGAGYNGRMKVSSEVITQLSDMGIRVVVENTSNAVESYNRLKDSHRTVAALHLTC